MRIAIDANEGFRQELVGIGRYARELVRHLAALDPREELIFLGIRSPKMEYDFVQPKSLRLLRSPAYRSLWSQVRLPLHLLRHRYDLVHLLEHKIPILYKHKTVVTIHDLGIYKFPDTIPKLERERFYLFTREAILNATHIITISQSSKRDICNIFGISPERIDVVYHGVDHSFYKLNVTPTKRKHPYILSVGTLQPRKNYVLLIRAFKRLCATLSVPIELLIVGKGWISDEIVKEAKEQPFTDRIHLLGYISQDQMPALYAGATMVATPSLYEGFGISVIEAMASGTPVVAANTSSLPEVVGSAGLLIDPRDELLWVETMRDLITDPAQLQVLRERGILQARKFTWKRTAEETLTVYRKILDNTRVSM